VQILHPFSGSFQQYEAAIAGPGCYRPDHCPQCGAQHPLSAHGFYRRTFVEVGFDGVIRVRRYLCRCCQRTVSLLPQFALPYLRFSVVVIALFLIARLLEGRTLVAAAAAASQPHTPYQRGQFWVRRFRRQAEALCAALAALAAGTSCTISVTFTPSTLTAETATLTVSDSAVATQYQTLTSSLGGSGVPDAKLTPGSHNFGTVAKGMPSNPQTFTLHNSELTALSVSIGFTGTNAGDFSLSDNNCGTKLASYASCTFSVTFTPSTTGPEKATLAVKDNAAAARYQTLSSSLTGTGK
jgi:hypothetical protein